MPNWAHDNVMDFGLDHVRLNTTRIVACQGAPLTYIDANTAVVAGMSLGSLGGITAADFSLGNDLSSGRKLTLLPQVIQITYAGTFDHLALVDDLHSLLLYRFAVTAPQPVVGGNTASTPDVSITLTDPV